MVTHDTGVCAISTHADAGVVRYIGAGAGAGIGSGAGAAGAVAAGPILSNAPSLDQMKGWSVCFTGAGGAGVGGAGTVCGGIQQDPNGDWQFNDIVTVQGSAQLSTSGGVSGSATIVRTSVLVSDGGALTVIREPVEQLSVVGDWGAEQFTELVEATGKVPGGVRCLISRGPLAQCD